jgi:hypothetical protein
MMTTIWGALKSLLRARRDRRRGQVQRVDWHAFREFSEADDRELEARLIKHAGSVLKVGS